MKTDFEDLDVKLSATTNQNIGAAFHCDRYREKTVQIYGTFTATVEIQASLNGTDYFAVQSNISAGGAYAVAFTCKFIRIKTTAYTNGTPKAKFGGFDSRSDV